MEAVDDHAVGVDQDRLDPASAEDRSLEQRELLRVDDVRVVVVRDERRRGDPRRDRSALGSCQPLR